MKNASWILLGWLFLASCTGNEADKQADIDPANEEQADSIKTGNELNEQTIAVLDNAEIFRFTKSNTLKFNWNSFQLARFWKEDSLLTSDFEPEPGYYKNYGPLLVYSPDSSKFIDLDSYNISIRTNGNGQRIAHPQGPDTEVSLVDLKKNKSTRLLFIGPGNSIEDAAWLDNQNLVLISSADNEESGTNASVIKYNLPSQTYYVYETADTSIANSLKGYWKRERLKNIIIR